MPLSHDFLHSGLTHISLVSFLWELANSAKPDQTAQNAASDNVIHCMK